MPRKNPLVDDRYKEIAEALVAYTNYENKNGVGIEISKYYLMAVQAAYDLYKNAHRANLMLPTYRKLFLAACQKAKTCIRKYIKQETGGTFEELEQYGQEHSENYEPIELYYKVLSYEGYYILDSYLLYIEKNRPREERFYEPRRFRLKEVVDNIQLLEDDGLDELFIHQPPRTGKSGVVTMATAWHIGRNPEPSNLYVTYKESLGGAYLEGVMEILTDPTYCHMDVFPDTKIVYTDSKNHKIDLGRRKKYKTLSGKGLEAGLNGEYDAKGWMIIDDPLEGIQDVLNPDTLHRKQIVFDNNVMSRKKEKCKVLNIGTIWSLNDIFSKRLEFLESNPKAANIRYKVIRIPALNEKDESNFNYKCDGGYSTEYYQALRAKFEDNGDIASWCAQYQQEPIERDGAIFKIEDMHFYNGVLPTEGLYRICAACDVALGGEDYLSFPVAYMYEDGSVYIHDVVFDNSEKKITKPKVIEKIIDNDVGSALFEANQGGEGYKDEIDTELKAKGIKINLRSEYAPTTMRKEQRIWDKAGSIRDFYFKDTAYRDKEYRMFMTNLFSFSMKNKSKHRHEDAADSLATLAYFIEGTWQNAKVEAMVNPFRRGGIYGH